MNRTTKYWDTYLSGMSVKSSLVLNCTIHKNYRAIRRPRVNCPQCWTMYNEKHGVKE